MFRPAVLFTCLVLFLSGLTTAASAQWFNHPTPGVPRLKNGQPNLAAPAPRTADHHPDFTGIWLHNNPLPCPAFMRDDTGECTEKIGLPPEAINFGASLKDGPPYQPTS